MAFRSGTFDVAICGFMGWYDCFDFDRQDFTQPDSKAPEVRRILRDGGRFVCCSWEVQKGITWMEEAILRHYPEILQDREYLERRPIGMAYEKAEGYEVILRHSGFRGIEVCRETMTFVSTDRKEWWRQMQHVGWESLLKNIEKRNPEQLEQVRNAILQDLAEHEQADGILFDKTVFFVSGVK